MLTAPFLFQPYRFSIHFIASTPVTFPSYRCVAERLVAKSEDQKKGAHHNRAIRRPLFFCEDEQTAERQQHCAVGTRRVMRAQRLRVSGHEFGLVAWSQGIEVGAQTGSHCPLDHRVFAAQYVQILSYPYFNCGDTLRQQIVIGVGFENRRRARYSR